MVYASHWELRWSSCCENWWRWNADAVPPSVVMTFLFSNGLPREPFSVSLSRFIIGRPRKLLWDCVLEIGRLRRPSLSVRVEELVVWGAERKPLVGETKIILILKEEKPSCVRLWLLEETIINSYKNKKTPSQWTWWTFVCCGAESAVLILFVVDDSIFGAYAKSFGFNGTK
jgi:hypothetical protein